jgi:hypothetical protein
VAALVVGQIVMVRGFVTQLKFLAGRPLREIESLLGFHSGRLQRGAAFAALDRLPTINGFETAGYSQVAAHRHVMPAGLDPVALRRMAMAAWALSGPNRLIKVLPETLHDTAMRDDDQYPPGQGVPQWRLTEPIPAKIAAILTLPNDIFRM